MKNISTELLKKIVVASNNLAKKVEEKKEELKKEPNVIVETKEVFVYAPPKDKKVKALNDPPTYNLPPEVLDNNCIDPRADPRYVIAWCNGETPSLFIGMEIGKTFQVGGYIHDNRVSEHYFVHKAARGKEPFVFKNELALRKVRENNTRLR